MTVTTEVETHHALQGHTVRKIGSWSEWLSRWEESESFETLLGLLHCGFKVPLQGATETQASRISFYLDLADGHSHFELYDESSGDINGTADTHHRARQHRRHELHRQLGQMAFKKVVTEYFSQADKNRDRDPGWLCLLEEPGMLEKVLWFLRPDSQQSKLHNEFRFAEGVPKWHFEQLAGFAFRLVELGWEYSGRRSQPDDGVSARFLAARPQFVKILVALNKLDVLRRRSEYPLDDASRDALREVALSNTGYLYNLETGERETRSPIDLKEAFWAGSKAAAILMADQMATEAAREAAGLRDAISAREEAERQVEAMRSSPKSSIEN